MTSPYSLDRSEIAYLRDVVRNPSIVDVIHRHSEGGSCALVVHDGEHEGGLTMDIGDSEDELRGRLAERLEALKELDELAELGVGCARYSDLMESVKESARAEGRDIEGIRGIAFVRAWLDYSESMSAGWMGRSPEALERVVGGVVAAHQVADPGPRY